MAKSFFYLIFHNLGPTSTFYINRNPVLKLNSNQELLKAEFTKDNEVAYLMSEIVENKKQIIRLYKTKGNLHKKFLKRNFRL